MLLQSSCASRLHPDAAASSLVSSDKVQSRAPDTVQKVDASAHVRSPLQGPETPKELSPQTLALPYVAVLVHPRALQLKREVGGSSPQHLTLYVAVAGAHDVVYSVAAAPSPTAKPDAHGVLVHSSWESRLHPVALASLLLSSASEQSRAPGLVLRRAKDEQHEMSDEHRKVHYPMLTYQ